MPLNVQSSENSIIQVAETAAVGGAGVGGSGGNAVAVTDQDASITDNDSLVSSSPAYAPEYFPWSGPDMNLQISANPIIQVGTSVAVGGPGIGGNGGDAVAVTDQDATIFDNDFLASF